MACLLQEQHQALDEHGQADRHGDGRLHVHDAHFQGAEMRAGADVPVDVVDAFDDAGVQHGVMKLFECLPCVEVGRDVVVAAGGQHAVPVGGEPGVLAMPERRVGRQGDQYRKIDLEFAHEPERLVAARHAQVHVGCEGHLVVAEQARLAFHGQVARLRRDSGRAPAEGVGAGTTQLHAQFPAAQLHVGDQCTHVPFQSGSIPARVGGNLDGVLDHLRLDVDTARVELHERHDAVDQVHGVAVDQLEFHLHPDRESCRGPEWQAHVAVSEYSGTASRTTWSKKAAPTRSTPSSMSNDGLCRGIYCMSSERAPKRT